MFRLKLQNLLVVLPFVALAQAALPPTGKFRIFSTNSTGGHNLFDVAGADTTPPVIGTTRIIAQFANVVPANSLNQQWIATQAFLNGVNLYSFISLEKFNSGNVYFGVPTPAAGLGAFINSLPTFFTLNEITGSTGVYTILVANTNLALTAANAPSDILVQPLNASNTLQHWQFAAVA